MSFNIDEAISADNNYADFDCRKISQAYKGELLNAQEGICAYNGKLACYIQPSEIYYIKVMGNKAFLFDEGKLYELKQEPYKIEEYLENKDFVRASKTVIISLSKISSLGFSRNGCYEATLNNGEKLAVSWLYVSKIKKKLNRVV